MSVIVQIQVSGRDRPGVTSTLTSILAQHGIPILDMNLSVTCETLSLGLLVTLEEEPARCPAFGELESRVMDLELAVQGHVVSAGGYSVWTREQHAPRHILTLLGREISARHIAETTKLVSASGLSIDRIIRLSAPQGLDVGRSQRLACFEMNLHGAVNDVPTLHGAFLRLAGEIGLDIAFQEDDVFRRHRRLICFDMDSTLIQAEVIDELAAEIGIKDQVAAITESAMRGDIDFKESFRRRMALLKGLDESVLEQVAERLPLTEGAVRLISNLKTRGYKVAVLSGGFTYFAEHLRKRLDIDYIHANTLDFQDGKLTGEVVGDIVDGARKAALLQEIAEREGIRMEQVIAVGDGANDLSMLSIAGLGIAFHAKPGVREQARHSLNQVGLDGVLYLLGIRDRELPL